jgi:hypothetical protein
MKRWLPTIGIGIVAALIIGGALWKGGTAWRYLLGSPATADRPFTVNGQQPCDGYQVLTFSATGPLDWLKVGDAVTLVLIPAPATPVATSTAATPATPQGVPTRTPRPGTAVETTTALEDVVILAIRGAGGAGTGTLIVAVPPRYDLSTLGRLSDKTVARPVYTNRSSRPQASCLTI